MSPNENAQRHVRLAVDVTFTQMLPAFRQLPAFATAFTSIAGNGVATCTVQDGQFEDFFLVFDASIEVAMHASMRVVAMDGAHMPNLRKDLRLLVLEGVTSNNSIYTIAFMLCWGETIRTVGRFFDLLKEHRPIFYDSWFDNDATTLIADRGPGKFFKDVVFQKLANGPAMLRSCVLHVVRAAEKKFVAWMRCKQNSDLIWGIGSALDSTKAHTMLQAVRESSADVADYVYSDWLYWCPAFIPSGKAHFYKITSNNVEQEFSRFAKYGIRSKDPVSMCLDICALVGKCHDDFKKMCRRQQHQGLMLTPFASTLHDREKSAVVSENLFVTGFNPNNYSQQCNVLVRGQQATQRPVAHTSYIGCTCEFSSAMLIPCKHMEAWRQNATICMGLNPQVAYKTWVERKCVPCLMDCLD
jgi:hypothetical protein